MQEDEYRKDDNDVHVKEPFQWHEPKMTRILHVEKKVLKVGMHQLPKLVP